ncbi:hypothetical protein FPV67DRAFT_1523341 [Lyophyllum atratum]|nr:hypothetical protein FPV67DRAFT_1523341 [Lyophyllum atratum]
MTTPCIPQLSFPQEIIETIIDELAGDNRTLLKCSLVSSSFREPSQRTLFRSLRIHLHLDYKTRNSNLHRMLETNQSISSSVTSMCFYFYDDSDEPEFSGEVNSMGFFGAPLTLPRVQALTLDALSSGIDWSELTIPLQTDLIHLMRSPMLVRLSIIEIGVPLDLLRTVVQLKCLEIRNSDYTLQDYPPSEMPHPIQLSSDPGYLDVLILLDEIPYIQDHASHLSLTRLRGFSGIIERQDDLGSYQEILNLSASTLESLSLLMGGNYTGPIPEHPDFRSLLHLEWLEIDISVGRSSNFLEFAWLARALGTIPPTNSIRTIIIRVRDYALENWGQIDEVLTREPHSLPLQRVFVSLPSYQFFLLPRLFSKGILFEDRRLSGQTR